MASHRVNAGRAERDAGPRSVLVLTPEPFRLRAAPLLLETPFAGGLGGPRRNPPPLDFQRSPELFHHALQRELSVSALAAFVLGDSAQHRAGARNDPPLLRLGQRGRRFDVEDGFDSR